MPVAWRIVKEAYAESAFDGEGSFRYGGRWNSRGIRVAYASWALSLAVLENLVRLEPPLSARFVSIRIEFDESLVERVPMDRLPEWNAEFPASVSQSIGDTWAREVRSPILEIPSAIVPVESNYLVNPLHPGFAKVGVDAPSAFAFDQRLISRG